MPPLTLTNPKYRFRGEPTAIIKVGSPPHDYHVHKSFLCDVSPFFRAALQGQFKESVDGVVSLLEENPDAFDRFLGWLYRREYDIRRLVNETSDEDYYSMIIKDYVFADKLQVGAYQKRIIDRVVCDYQNRSISPMHLQSVLELYAKTQEASSLRKLALAMYQWARPSWFRGPEQIQALQKLPQFTVDLVQKLAKREIGDVKDLKAEDFYDEARSHDIVSSIEPEDL